MTTLLNAYIEALKKKQLQKAATIEKDYIEKANSYSTFTGRDYWISKLTEASI